MVQPLYGDNSNKRHNDSTEDRQEQISNKVTDYRFLP
jgi:hypothetical protein